MQRTTINKHYVKELDTLAEIHDIRIPDSVNTVIGTLNTDNSTAQTVNGNEALNGTVNLHKVSKTGNYNDLLNKPTLGTAAALDVASSGNASSSQVVKGNDSRLTDSRNAADVYSWAKASTKPSYTANEVGAIPTTEKGANSGVAELDSTGKVPSSQLPSYVDDVLEYSAQSAFPATGETGKIYVAQDTNKTYRWSGSAYVEISESLALGETSSTAYRGDRGKTAYDHSQITNSSNPHNTTLDSLTDTNIQSLSGNQILKYNSTSGKWENSNLQSERSNTNSGQYDVGFSIETGSVNLNTNKYLCDTYAVFELNTNNVTNGPVGVTFGGVSPFKSKLISYRTLYTGDVYRQEITNGAFTSYYRFYKRGYGAVTPQSLTGTPNIGNVDANGWIKVVEAYPDYAGNTGCVLAVNSDEDDVEWIPVATNAQIDALFTGFSVTVSAGTGGTASASTNNVSYGGSVTLTATPNSGYTFSQWSDGVSTNPRTITNVQNNINLSASFNAPTKTFTVRLEEDIDNSPEPFMDSNGFENAFGYVESNGNELQTYETGYDSSPTCYYRIYEDVPSSDIVVYFSDAVVGTMVSQSVTPDSATVDGEPVTIEMENGYYISFHTDDINDNADIVIKYVVVQY